MRKESRIAIGIVGFSALASSYLLGQGNIPISTFAASPVGSGATVTAGEVAPDASATPSSAPSSTPTAPDQTATAKPATKPSAKPTTTTKATTTKTATPTQAAPTGGNFTSDPVKYQYGTMQLEVVVSGGQLTGINLVQASTHGSQYAPVPGLLVDAALQAGGSNFGNLSGATFATQAFKKALDGALLKAGL